MRPGQVLLSPGGKNLEFETVGNEVRIRIIDPPQEQIYTPSVDALFKSAATVYNRHLLAVVLTGMGNDGASGNTLRDGKEGSGAGGGMVGASCSISTVSSHTACEA